MTDALSTIALRSAVTQSISLYLASRHERIKPFTQKHFSFKGALRINRRALGKDLLRAPANVIWAAPYLLSRGGLALSRRAGLQSACALLERLPPGLKTDVEREVEWLIYSEFLELPFQQGHRHCSKDALFVTILQHPTVSELLAPELVRLDALAQQQAFCRNLEHFLRTYTSSRTAAAELTGALLSLAAGVSAFNKFTPGTLAIGNAAATAIAHNLAVANFFLGPTLGSLYYGAFPATASAGLLASTIGGLMITLGVIAACAGIIADPVQQALGIHQRKLKRLLVALEAELLGEKKGYQLRDAYIARVFDLWDLLQTATRTLG